MYHPKTTVLERPFQSDRLPSQSDHLRAIVSEKLSQSDRPRATVSERPEVLGLKEAVSFLKDKTDGGVLLRHDLVIDAHNNQPCYK